MICFPLGRPRNVVADEQGRIYVALQPYARVQVYNKNGSFLFGFFTRAGAGAFFVRIDPDGRLNVATARSDRLHVYDRNGKLLSTKITNGKIYDQLANKRVNGFVDEAGNRYLVRGPLFSPSVYRLDPHGNVTLRIKNLIVLFPLTSSWLTLAFGASVFLSLKNWKANRRTVAGCEDMFPCGRIRRRDVLLRYHDSYRDVILTSRGVCWARNVWNPYDGIGYSDLRVSLLKRRTLFIFKREIHIQSKSDPTISIRFSPKNAQQWLSQIEMHNFYDCEE
jgi:hypothetical protein